VAEYILRIKPEQAQAWSEINLREVTTLGRSSDNDVIVNDRLASRHHAQILIENDQIYLKDLGSSNGTKIMGRKIQAGHPFPFSAGGFFSIGDTLLQVVAKQSNQRYHLWYRIENQTWQQVTFDQDVLVGRGEDCDLPLSESHVSRHHCLIQTKDGVFFLKDLGSQNGSYLEEQRLPANSPVRVYPGQYFRVGRVTMTVASVDDEVNYQRAVVKAVSHEALGSLKQQAIQSVTPAQPQAAMPSAKKSNAWIWLVGLGALMMMCACMVVLGGLYVINQPRSVVPIAQEVDSGTTYRTRTPREEITLPTDDSSAMVVTDTPQPTQEEVQPDLATKRKWLIMMYQNGDDELLEYYIHFDVIAAESIGSTDEVAIVAQLDRYQGGFTGDGNWSTARRYYLTQGDNLDSIQSEMVVDLGEVDSGNVETLVDFAIWAINTYPAENYALILSDHGMGWFGGYTDSDNNNMDGIYLPALESALAYIVTQTGIGQLDIIGFDACLMAEVEVWAAVAPYARIGVASEESESATGWAYSGFLQRLIDNAEMDAYDLSKAIVETFVIEDLYYEINNFDPNYVMQDSTLSAIRLYELDAVIDALDGLVGTLENVDQAKVAEARTFTRNYEGFSDTEPFFLDLQHFGEMVCFTTSNNDVCDASDQLTSSIQSAVIINRAGRNMSGSNGVTIYFPDSSFFDLTKDNSYGFAYRVHANRFTDRSLWDEFLDFHYQIENRMP
jgi:pSer/pThr/pTyr-binding forkhead associated (FHA) protein